MDDKDKPPLQKEASEKLDFGGIKTPTEGSFKIKSEIKPAEQKLAVTPAQSTEQVNNNASKAEAVKSGAFGLSGSENLETNKRPLLTEPLSQKHIAIVGIILVICLSIALYSPNILGMRLNALYAISNALPPSQSVQIVLAYADALTATKHYEQAISIYKTAAKQIKASNLNKQLLSLVDFKLAQILLETEPVKTEEINDFIKEAMANLGDPNRSTPTNLVETIRGLAVYYTDKDDPYAAYPLAKTASRFWQTGATRNSEGNTYQDIGEKFKDKQAWGLAYICYERAFSISKDWGNTNFNAYRLGEMGLAKAKLEQTKEVADLLKRAMDIDQKVHNGSLYNTADCLPAYVNCLINLSEIYEAKKVIRQFYTYFDAKDYYDCQKKLALAYQKNKNNDQAIDILKDMLQDEAAGKDVPNVPTIRKTLSALEKSTHPRVK